MTDVHYFMEDHNSSSRLNNYAILQTCMKVNSCSLQIGFKKRMDDRRIDTNT